jgi:hypothetical protein
MIAERAHPRGQKPPLSGHVALGEFQAISRRVGLVLSRESLRCKQSFSLVALMDETRDKAAFLRMGTFGLSVPLP